jgi:chromosome partitioning protein
MKKAKVYAITNQKGGVAKTTTTINLAAYLASMGKTCLVVDLDPQGNATSGLGLDKSLVKESLYQVMIDEVPVKNVIFMSTMEHLDIAASSIDLAAAELEMINLISRETRLRTAITDVLDFYDYILIDCPPSLGILTINAFAAADRVVIPVQSEYYALEGLGQLLKTIKMVQNSLNEDLDIAGALLTMFDARTNLAEEVKNELINYLGDKVYHSIIPRNVRLSEAPSFGQSILQYAPESRGAVAYQEFAREFIAIEEDGLRQKREAS